MTSKELVLSAVYNRETPRAPWVPFVGCHAASLIGVDCEEYFKSADNIVAGVEAAVQAYRPDGLPALFDLQIEAEALGCRLQWAKENPPAVRSHPLEEGIALADLVLPDETSGRFPVVLDAMRRICAGVGQEIAVYGLITGPFTLALHLMGTEIFYEMSDTPEVVHRLMAFTTEVAIRTAGMYAETGCDIIALVDPMTSQISPAHFTEYVTPYVTRVFDAIRSMGKAGTFFVCGNAKNNIEVMCGCHADGLSIDENIPLAFVRDICRREGMSFGGNIKLTVTMLFGTPADNINDAMNCLEIGGTKGFILSPGCDMPFAVPPQNVRAISALVHGEVADFLEGSNPLEGVVVELPDYTDPACIHVDVITLDAESCAPCQYMMEATAAAAARFGDKVVYREHSIKKKEGVAAMIQLGATNIPTVVIDGVIAFVSIIPDEDHYAAALAAALARKGL